MVTVTQNDNKFTLENGFLTAVVNDYGQIISMKIGSREIVAPGVYCNQFCLYDDVPLFWDAWDVMDYHLETRREQNQLLGRVQISKNDRMEAILEFKMGIGSSSWMNQRIIWSVQRFIIDHIFIVIRIVLVIVTIVFFCDLYIFRNGK